VKFSGKFRGIAAVAAVGVALGLSGCSGGAGGDDDVLNVGQISDSVAFFPLYVAEQNGYFEEEGVTLGERPRLGTGAKLAAALTSGSIDVAAGVITDAFNLANSDDNTLLTGSLVTEYYVDIIVGPDFEQSSGSLEDKIKSLEGTNIGITGPGSGTEALVNYLFDQVGLDPESDATLVNLGGQPSSAIGALESGQVDALAFFQPAGQMAETQGTGEIYISPQRGDVPDMAGALHGVTFSTQTAIDAKPELIAGFNVAIDKALKFIAENPDEAAELLASYLGESSPETVDALAELLPEEMSPGVAVSQESYDIAAKFHEESGLVASTPDYADFVWEGGQ
jgi:ABC-type nitrate/sulfonate/bicarbonate transport system substrate-binding protein